MSVCVLVCCYLTCIRALFPFTHRHADSHSYTVGKYTITISKKFLLHFDTKRRRVLLVVALVIVVTPCLCDTLIMPYHTHTYTRTRLHCAHLFFFFFYLRSIAANVAVDVAATQEASEQQQQQQKQRSNSNKAIGGNSSTKQQLTAVTQKISEMERKLQQGAKAAATTTQ